MGHVVEEFPVGGARGGAASPTSRLSSEGPESLAAIVDRFTASGYREGLTSDDGAVLVAMDGRVYGVADLLVEEVVRFEGSTDPDDQAIVFAVFAPRDGMRGTFVVAFGPSIDRRDAVVAAHLRAAPVP